MRGSVIATGLAIILSACSPAPSVVAPTPTVTAAVKISDVVADYTQTVAHVQITYNNVDTGVYQFGFFNNLLTQYRPLLFRNAGQLKLDARM